MAGDWRRILADDPTNARPVVSALLNGRVIITPTSRSKEWTLSGEGTLVGLFARAIVPTIYPSVVRPQADPWKGAGTNSEGLRPEHRRATPVISCRFRFKTSRTTRACQSRSQFGIVQPVTKARHGFADDCPI
jgi:hypothetical protein